MTDETKATLILAAATLAAAKIATPSDAPQIMPHFKDQAASRMREAVKTVWEAYLNFPPVDKEGGHVF